MVRVLETSILRHWKSDKHLSLVIIFTQKDCQLKKSKLLKQSWPQGTRPSCIHQRFHSEYGWFLRHTFHRFDVLFFSDTSNLATQINFLLLLFVRPFRYPFELSVRKRKYPSICNIWSKAEFSWMGNHGMSQTMYIPNRKNAGFHLSSVRRADL